MDRTAWTFRILDWFVYKDIQYIYTVHKRFKNFENSCKFGCKRKIYEMIIKNFNILCLALCLSVNTTSKRKFGIYLLVAAKSQYIVFN